MSCKETMGVGDLYCTLAKRLGVLTSAADNPVFV
jgi:hypothetical protein